LDFGHSRLRFQLRRAGTPFNSPLPFAPKQKTKLKFFFRAIPIAIGIKVKHAHHITRHIWLRLFTKTSTHICLRYATANIRYAETLAVRLKLNNMKIKIFHAYPNKIIDELKSFDMEIEGKLATYFEKLKPGEQPDYPPITRVFNCNYDNTYSRAFNLNYLFELQGLLDEDTMEDPDADMFPWWGYAHLNLIQRLILSWTFKRNWLQKPENIKWLISIPISILTALITTLIINK